MATLYQLTDRWLAALDGAWSYDEETGEVFDPADIDEIEASFNEKVENIACYIKNIKSDIHAIRTEEDALKERRQRYERHAERLGAYLSDQMARAGRRRIETTRADVSLRRVTSVQVEDEDAVPEEFVRTTIRKTPDKRMISHAIRDGIEVPGCSIVERDSIQVR